MRTRALTAVAVAGWLGLASWPRAQEYPVLVAMQEELTRSMDGLRMKDGPAPYYIAYRIDDVVATSTAASLGAVLQNNTNHRRTLGVDVRVGDYGFDNSLFLTNPPTLPAAATIPLEDDVVAIRRQIWLSTDRAYKRAVNVYARKRAAFQNRAADEHVPDLSREAPTEKLLGPTRPPTAAPAWADAARQISGVFDAKPDIQASDVVFAESRGTRYYVNSEGFKLVEPIQIASVRALAETQAADGMVLRDVVALVGSSPADLPSTRDLTDRVGELATHLSAMRTAPVGPVYTGPVLFEDQAAAELLLQTFVPLFTSRRPPDAEDPRLATAVQTLATPYLSRIGSRILPESFSVSDTPSLSHYGNVAVPGAYTVDDEGVPAQDVTLVDNGVLRALLAGRTPQKGVLQSNGHARGGSVYPGVFQIKHTGGGSSAELEQRYVQMLRQQGKAFGYVVQRIGNQGSLQPVAFDTAEPLNLGPPGPGGVPTALPILRAVRISADGREEPVRGLQLGPVTYSAFRNVADASNDRILFSTRLPGGTAVSMIVPNLIFEELELQRARSAAQRAPLVPSPLIRR